MTATTAIATKLTDAHYSHLRSEGFTENEIQLMEELWGVRSLDLEESKGMGFWVNTAEGVKSSAGLYFPFTDNFGQIRCDRKLKRVSESGKEGRIAKYLTQSKMTSKPWFPKSRHIGDAHRLGLSSAKVSAVTEGYKDAARATLFTKVTTVALAGVSHYRKALPLDSLEYKQVMGSVMLFDHDAWVNSAVFTNLVNAAAWIKGKIQVIPEIEGQPKAGLCEYFNAGHTPEDYRSLLDSAMAIEDFLLALPSHWTAAKLGSIRKMESCIKAVFALSIRYCKDSVTSLLIDAISKNLKLGKTEIKNYLRNVQARHVRKQMDNAIADVRSNPKEKLNFNQMLIRDLYSKDSYICVGNESNSVLYKWNKNRYEKRESAVERRRIRDYCNNHTVIDEKGYITYPFADPKFVSRGWEWVKLTFGIDSNLVNPPGLNCTNGVLEIKWEKRITADRVLDIPSWQLVEHDPSKHFYLFEPYVRFDPEADTSYADRVLECLDEAEREIYLRTIAASIDLQTTRKSLGRVRALFCTGVGSNGKDTLNGFVDAIYGFEGVSSVSISDFSAYDAGRKFPLLRLRRSRINSSSENLMNQRIDSIQSLKSVISGDKMSFEPKGRDEEEGVAKCVLIFNSNETPVLTGALEAIKSRVASLHFKKTFVDRTPDPKKGELRADPRFKNDFQFVKESVLPGFLNRVLEAFLRMQSEGRINYDASDRNIEAIKLEFNHLYQFCQDVGLEYCPGSKVTSSEVWEKLESWYLERGIIEIETNGKKSWNELDSKLDKLVKGKNQVKERILKLFPQANTGRTSKYSFIENIAFVDPEEKAKQMALDCDSSPENDEKKSEKISSEVVLHNSNPVALSLNHAPLGDETQSNPVAFVQHSTPDRVAQMEVTEEAPIASIVPVEKIAVVEPEVLPQEKPVKSKAKNKETVTSVDRAIALDDNQINLSQSEVTEVIDFDPETQEEQWLEATEECIYAMLESQTIEDCERWGSKYSYPIRKACWKALSGRVNGKEAKARITALKKEAKHD